MAHDLELARRVPEATRARIRLAARLLLAAAAALPARAGAAAALELYGTLHSMGVVVSLTAGEDGNRNAAASVAFRVAGGEWRTGFPLSRVAADRFVGSLFFLSPGTSYEVRVTLADPDGAPLDGATLSGTAATRAEPTLPAATRTYQVGPSGAGSACTAASPCALATALGLVQAGEEVVLRGGVYTVGDLALSHGGTAAAPIVIRAAAGEAPVLDGGDPAAFSWVAEGGGVYRTTVNAGDPPDHHRGAARRHRPGGERTLGGAGLLGRGRAATTGWRRADSSRTPGSPSPASTTAGSAPGRTWAPSSATPAEGCA